MKVSVQFKKNTINITTHKYPYLACPVYSFWIKLIWSVLMYYDFFLILSTNGLKDQWKTKTKVFFRTLTFNQLLLITLNLLELLTA